MQLRPSLKDNKIRCVQVLNIDWLIVAGVDAVVADVGGHAIFEIKVSCDVFVLKEILTYHLPSDSP